MPYNGSGTFVLTYNWETDKANGIKIRADRMYGQDTDMATGLSTAITKDGQTTVTANLPMATFKHTNVGAASSRTEYVRGSQAQDNDLTYFTTAGDGAAYTLTPAPAITSLTAGQAWDVLFHTVNTGTTPTLQVSGLAAVNILNSDLTSITAAELNAGGIRRVQYDGTQFQVVNKTTAGLANGGTQNANFNAAANFYYLVDCDGQDVTATLPAAPTVRTQIQFSKFGTGVFTVDLNGEKYNGSTGDPVATREGTPLLTYTGTSRGWVVG